MKLTGAIQEALLCLLCFDDKPMGGKFVVSLLPAKTYDPYYRQLAESAIDYINQWKKVPGEHTLDLIATLKEKDGESGDIYDRIYSSMRGTIAGLNREYVIQQASKFARHQRMRRGITKAIELLQSENENAIDEAEAAILSSTKATNDLFNPGIRLSDSARSLAFLDEEEEAFPTGIEELDKYGLGPARKKLHLLLAPPKKGKTWWMIHCAKYAHMIGKQVVHITLEMSEKEICQRYVQSMFSVSKREGTYYKQMFLADDLGSFQSSDIHSIKGRPFLQDKGIRKTLTKKLAPLAHRAPIIVKEFPTGQLTINELKAYLDGLEAQQRIIPDLLIVDYVDLMDIDSKTYRHSLGKLYKDLRGIGVERNIAVATASQSNRDGAKAKVIKEGNVAEDFSKIGTIDTGISLNQTDSEYELGLARLHVFAARGDVKNANILISQAYALGQFCMDSVRMSGRYWDMVKRVAEENGDNEEE